MENKISNEESLKAILIEMRDLLDAIEIKDAYFSLPPNFQPTKDTVNTIEAFARIDTALAIANDKLKDQVDELFKLDPVRFITILRVFFREWEKENREKMGFFYYCKLQIKVYVEKKYHSHLAANSFL